MVGHYDHSMKIQALQKDGTSHQLRIYHISKERPAQLYYKIHSKL